jgi:hypothetical protein
MPICVIGASSWLRHTEWMTAETTRHLIRAAGSSAQTFGILICFVLASRPGLAQEQASQPSRALEPAVFLLPLDSPTNRPFSGLFGTEGAPRSGARPNATQLFALSDLSSGLPTDAIAVPRVSVSDFRFAPQTTQQPPEPITLDSRHSCLKPVATSRRSLAAAQRG